MKRLLRFLTLVPLFWGGFRKSFGMVYALRVAWANSRNRLTVEEQRRGLEIAAKLYAPSPVSGAGGKDE